MVGMNIVVVKADAEGHVDVAVRKRRPSNTRTRSAASW